MAFDRLQKLGDEKLQRIVNELMRGTPAPMLARLIQQEWGDAQDVGEESLARQLKRLHGAICNGAFGGELAAEARLRASVRIKLFHGANVDCLDELIQLALIQKERVFILVERERLLGKPSASLSPMIRLYMDLLESVQKIKFDLGLDEYRRGMPINRATVIVPDQTSRGIEQRLIEAVSAMEEIFGKSGIE
jgi:hypothetical protein